MTLFTTQARGLVIGPTDYVPGLYEVEKRILKVVHTHDYRV